MAPLKLEVENLLVVSLVSFIYYIFYILRTVSLFFLVHQAKRTINTNDHVCDWRRETGKALVSRSCAARHSRAQALPSLNLNKKRDCSQSIVLQTVSAKVKEIITGDACYSGENKTKLQDYDVEWSKIIKLVPCKIPCEEENDHSKIFIRKP